MIKTLIFALLTAVLGDDCTMSDGFAFWSTIATPAVDAVCTGEMQSNFLVWLDASYPGLCTCAMTAAANGAAAAAATHLDCDVTHFYYGTHNVNGMIQAGCAACAAGG